jgi:hypothetical protein
VINLLRYGMESWIWDMFDGMDKVGIMGFLR